jgi:hypothetical protein
MAFDYYQRLSPRQRQIYDASDEVTALTLPKAEVLKELVSPIEENLKKEDRVALQEASQRLTTAIVQQLEAPPLRVRVLAARPSRNWGELHGLYEPAEGNASARVTLWMRTARRRQVVAFRTYLRTLLHELLHHFDYEYFRFPESFHTEGFFKRESSLFRQLVE